MPNYELGTDEDRRSGTTILYASLTFRAWLHAVYGIYRVV